MKFRAVANGNIVDDVPAGLVTAGIYVPVEDEGAEPAVMTRPAPDPVRPVVEPQSTAVAPMTTDDVPTPKKSTKRRGKKAR